MAQTAASSMLQLFPEAANWKKGTDGWGSSRGDTMVRLARLADVEAGSGVGGPDQPKLRRLRRREAADDD